MGRDTPPAELSGTSETHDITRYAVSELNSLFIKRALRFELREDLRAEGRDIRDTSPQSHTSCSHDCSSRFAHSADPDA